MYYNDTQSGNSCAQRAAKDLSNPVSFVVILCFYYHLYDIGVYISRTEYCTRLPLHRSKLHNAIYGEVHMGTLLLENQMFPGVYKCMPAPEGKVAIKCLDLVC